VIGAVLVAWIKITGFEYTFQKISCQSKRQEPVGAGLDCPVCYSFFCGVNEAAPIRKKKV
jgi:hypothetical protein